MHRWTMIAITWQGTGLINVYIINRYIYIVLKLEKLYLISIFNLSARCTNDIVSLDEHRH